MRPQRCSDLSRRKSLAVRVMLSSWAGPSPSLQRRDLRDIFVAAAAEVDHHDLLAADRRAVAQEPAERVRRLERGDDAFTFAEFVERLQREIVAAVVVLDASDLLEVRVFGADRWVIETGRNRMCFGDLTELVLQHHRSRSVQHAERAAAEARRVLAEVTSAAAGFNTDETDRFVFKHLVEKSERIRAAADACDRDVRQRAGALPQLRQ